MNKQQAFEKHFKRLTWKKQQAILDKLSAIQQQLED